MNRYTPFLANNLTNLPNKTNLINIQPKEKKSKGSSFLYYLSKINIGENNETLTNNINDTKSLNYIRERELISKKYKSSYDLNNYIPIISKRKESNHIINNNDNSDELGIILSTKPYNSDNIVSQPSHHCYNHYTYSPIKINRKLSKKIEINDDEFDISNIGPLDSEIQELPSINIEKNNYFNNKSFSPPLPYKNESKKQFDLFSNEKNVSVSKLIGKAMNNLSDNTIDERSKNTLTLDSNEIPGIIIYIFRYRIC